MSIMIDSREGSKELLNYYPLSEIGELCTLKSGDVCFMGNGSEGEILIGIEVKTYSDFISSCLTGRLQARQIPLMVDTYGEVYILLVGGYRYHPETTQLQVHGGDFKWRDFQRGSKQQETEWSYADHMILTITNLAVVTFKEVEDYQSAALWVMMCYYWWSKQWSEHKGMQTLNRAQKLKLSARDITGMTKRQVLVAGTAASIAGVGYRTAILACRYFKSQHEVITADAGQWVSAGVGPAMAKRIAFEVKAC